ncbi:unnamed protein product [Heligmosomoides polygyrus]|uniref:Uncharacterized protein n=1 Tax=Heligmosomoides polygyrus TaxID=6339 RepID=A0A3P8DQM1_HELPZ|nr:unnamed protein product [Heligmosomoides polygyrus]
MSIQPPLVAFQDLVKTHLTFAVREEVEVLRQTIAELEQRVRVVVLFYLYSFFTLRFRNHTKDYLTSHTRMLMNVKTYNCELLPWQTTPCVSTQSSKEPMEFNIQMTVINRLERYNYQQLSLT